MQEGTVGWDPITVCRNPPWQERLFVLYNLVVLGFAIIRSINLARHLWFGGALAKAKDVADSQFLYAWEMCKTKVVGMRRLAVLTMLATFLIVAHGATNIFAGVRLEKQTGIAAVAGGATELGAVVMQGILVCMVLYGLASFYDGILARRRAAWKFFHTNQAE